MDKKTASPDNAKCFRASYRRAKHDSMARYIHKYYLSQEVRQRIFLADIHAIMHEHDDWDVWGGNLPESPPCCVVHYEDLCLEKAITGHDVRLVLQAIAAYWHDLNGDLSDDENRAASNLNAWLMDWEKNLLAECVRTTEELEQRLRGGDPFLMDYEIPLSIRFFLREDDPLINDPLRDAKLDRILAHHRDPFYELDDTLPFYECDHLVIDNADGCIFGLTGKGQGKNKSLLCVVEELGSITAQEAADPDYSGLGDNSDHSEHMGNTELSRVHHCGLFHELYDHRHIPLKHLGRIGRVEVDFAVWHQRKIHLDLQGKCPVVGGIGLTAFLPARFPKGCRVVEWQTNTNGDAGGAAPFPAAKDKQKSHSVEVPFRLFDGQFNAYFNWGRYVHKYYLPLDLKRQIRPADIKGILSYYGGLDGLDLGKGIIPPGLPDVTIDYGAYSLGRRVSGETVRRVLLACSRYFQDYGAELSPQEKLTALAFNEQLIVLEKTLLAESIRLTEEMERRLQDNDPSLVKYEIELKISFYLRDDDPFSEDNNPDASEDDLDSDAGLVCVVDDFAGTITVREAADPDFTGLGDNHDHKSKDFAGDCKLSSVRHCVLFQRLYDYCGVPMKHMGRIGMIWTDFQVCHKGMVLLDLKGERPLVRWLNRKEIGLQGRYKSTLDLLDKFDQILYGAARK